MLSKIKKYTQLNGITGAEKVVKEEFKKTFTQNKTPIFTDNLGSICTLIPSQNKKVRNIGIFAHMDEVGLLIKHIQDNGNIKISNVGGLACKNLINQRVIIKKEAKEYIGVILANYEKEINKLDIHDLEVDFGFLNKEEVAKLDIQVGDYITFLGDLGALSNDKYVTKAADNRIGCAIVEKLYEDLVSQEHNCNIYLGATVQEEIGLKGAGTLLRSLDIEFDQIIVVDVSPVDNLETNKLGAGALLRIAEPRGLYNYQGNLELKEVAEQNSIAYQPYFSKGGTDGAMMLITGIGNKTNAICIPALNLHTCNTIFNINDVSSALKIIGAFIANENKK